MAWAFKLVHRETLNVYLLEGNWKNKKKVNSEQEVQRSRADFLLKIDSYTILMNELKIIQTKMLISS